MLEVYRRTGDPEAAESAVQCLRKAASMYPNSANTAGEWALALQMTGKQEAARRQAQRALELDRLTPHRDKKLSSEMVSSLELLLTQPALTPSTDST